MWEFVEEGIEDVEDQSKIVEMSRWNTNLRTSENGQSIPERMLKRNQVSLGKHNQESDGQKKCRGGKIK